MGDRRVWLWLCRRCGREYHSSHRYKVGICDVCCREASKVKNVNYSEISRKTGLSVSHISRVFRGIRKPSVGTLLAISKATKMPLKKLVGILALNSIE